MGGLRRVVRSFDAAVDRILPPPAGITMLIYHRVGGGSDSAVDLDPSTFERQLEHLAARHRVISIDRAVEELTATAPRPTGDDVGPGVVITFDDGTADFGDVVVPSIVEAGLPVTLYVATDFVESQRPFPPGVRPASWQQLREAVDTGLVTIGSHTHRHRLLHHADPATVDDELDRSCDLIADRLGVEPIHFAYPKAIKGSPAAERAVRTRFTSAALARNRVNRPGRSDLHRLGRTPIQRADDAETFARKAGGGHRLEGEARALVGRYRHRSDVT